MAGRDGEGVGIGIVFASSGTAKEGSAKAPPNRNLTPFLLADRPFNVETIASSLRDGSGENLPEVPAGKKELTRVVELRFDTFAVSVSTKTVIAHVSWKAYATTKKNLGAIDFHDVRLPEGSSSIIDGDGKLHLVTLDPLEAKEG